MVEDGWTPTDVEEPAITSPSTVGRHSRLASWLDIDGHSLSLTWLLLSYISLQSWC